MRHFLYDEENKRLVLVDGIFPSIPINGSKDDSRLVTPNSNQERVFNSLYVWEKVQLRGFNLPAAMNYEDNGVDYMVYAIKEDRSESLIMILPYNDVVIILGGSYLYNGQNSNKDANI